MIRHKKPTRRWVKPTHRKVKQNFLPIEFITDERYEPPWFSVVAGILTVVFGLGLCTFLSYGHLQGWW